MELRQRARAALATADPATKVTATQALWADAATLALDTTATDGFALHGDDAEAPLPGRPARPPLVAATAVPQRSPFTAEGFAGLVHAICHIEFNAINLALDAVWRFGGMPRDYYLDWLRVAHEEAYHFTLLEAQLRELGHAYGDFPAHDGLWTMTYKTRGDVLARMALVPRTLEARGLDASPQIQARLCKVGTPAALRTVEILDIILRDEVGHVAVGNHWYRWLCAREGIADPVAHYAALVLQYQAPRLRPPFNEAARLRAGFTPEEIAFLRAAPEAATSSAVVAAAGACPPSGRRTAPA